MMRKILGLVVVAILLVLSLASQVAAQDPEKSEKSEKDAKPAEAKPAPEPPAPREESSVTDHTIKIGGQTIAYKATASTTLIKDEKGEPTASIFTIAYTRSDAKDMSQRLLSFVYNGGPGWAPSVRAA
jgi:carboxypeptidase C (cathepsin A)